MIFSIQPKLYIKLKKSLYAIISLVLVSKLLNRKNKINTSESSKSYPVAVEKLNKSLIQKKEVY